MFVSIAFDVYGHILTHTGMEVNKMKKMEEMLLKS